MGKPLAKRSTPRPCIYCGADSMRILILGNRIVLRCAAPECNKVFEEVGVDPEGDLGNVIDNMLAAYERRLLSPIVQPTAEGWA